MISVQGKGTKAKTRAPACSCIYLWKIYYGNIVSRQFKFSLKRLDVDMHLTHPC